MRPFHNYPGEMLIGAGPQRPAGQVVRVHVYVDLGGILAHLSLVTEKPRRFPRWAKNCAVRAGRLTGCA